MSALKTVIVSVFVLVISFSTALAGWTTPPKLAHIPADYKNPTENWDASEEFRKLNFVQMLKDIDSYGKQVEACSDTSCCNEVTKKILNQFYPKYEKEMYENIQKMVDGMSESNLYIQGRCSYFCEPPGNYIAILAGKDTLSFYKEYLYYMLNFLSKEVSGFIFIKDYPEEI